jgi:hypothetical protein
MTNTKQGASPPAPPFPPKKKEWQPTQQPSRHGWISYKVKYDDDFRKAIKFYVPKQYREWDGENGLWIVAPHYTKVVELLKKRSFDVRYGINWYSAWRYLCIAQNAPPELIQAAVSILLEKYPEKYNEINTARILIQEYGRPHDAMISPPKKVATPTPKSTK